MIKPAAIIALFSLLLCASCAGNVKHRVVGEAPLNAVTIVSADDFDLHRIKSFILMMDEETIASIEPQHIKQGTNQPERQYAAWELAYLNTAPIYESLSRSNAALVIERITPISPTDRRIMLNPGPQVINIGGFDHTLIIWKPDESPNQHRWIYLSGAGRVCEGTVAFVIRE